MKTTNSKPETLTRIAERIREHLKRFEADSKREGHLSPFCVPSAHRAGRCVRVSYRRFQRFTSLTREEAEAYLRWLDAGNVGTHWEMRALDIIRW